MPDFSQLLSQNLDEVKKPPIWPAGTYLGVITKHEYGESSQKKTPFVRFFAKVQSAGPDIEQDALTGIDLSKREWRTEFYITPDANWRLKEFLAALGVPTEHRTLGECIPEALNLPVLMNIVQRPSQDGTEMVNYLDKLSAQV